MRNPADLYGLSFHLPRAIARVAAGRLAQLTEHGCGVEIREGFALIVAPHRDAAFNQAARLLRARGGNEPPAAIAAVLRAPGAAAGRDGWTIIVGADVAFAPTGLGAFFPAIDLMPETTALPSS